MNVPFGHDYQAQSPYAFGAAMNPYLQNAFTANQSLQNPQLMQNPQFSYGPQLQGSAGHNPLLNSGSLSGYAAGAGGQIPTQQLVPVLAQLAQQISVQSALIQQLGITLHQLAHQLTAQTLQYQGAGVGAGQGFGAGVSPFAGIGQASGPGGPFSAQNPFAGAPQGGYGGFNPQAQGWWGGNRSQTIQ
jgi:hypothetical protein